MNYSCSIACERHNLQMQVCCCLFVCLFVYIVFGYLTYINSNPQTNILCLSKSDNSIQFWEFEICNTISHISSMNITAFVCESDM